jgi:hypothetical protein
MWVAREVRRFILEMIFRLAGRFFGEEKSDTLRFYSKNRNVCAPSQRSFVPLRLSLRCIFCGGMNVQVLCCVFCLRDVKEAFLFFFFFFFPFFLFLQSSRAIKKFCGKTRILPKRKKIKGSTRCHR